jgi:hypothetical protein
MIYKKSFTDCLLVLRDFSQSSVPDFASTLGQEDGKKYQGMVKKRAGAISRTGADPHAPHPVVIG